MMNSIKEAVLKSLEELGGIVNSVQVCDHIIANGYWDFSTTKKPGNTVSSQLGHFIRNKDTRVKRTKLDKGIYGYYLTKNEANLTPQLRSTSVDTETHTLKGYGYLERDLHPLLSTYLNSENIYSKTVFHERSISAKDSNQVWTHPDMVGISFLNLETDVSESLLKRVKQTALFKLSSYELKRELNSDTDLKKAYFQAVSNSSWANYGYLVTFEYSNALLDEMERLNEAFGIGIIHLSSNPFESKVLFNSRYRELDFKTIDKLCTVNPDFNAFIEQCDNSLSVEKKYFSALIRELESICDKYLQNESEIMNYCEEKHIPVADLLDPLGV